jgi:hypothetical protein
MSYEGIDVRFLQKKVGGSQLGTKQRHSIVDFISILSVMATKACMVKNIHHEFIEAGMIDINNLQYPVFGKIISTCRRISSVEEYKNIENNMNTIIHESCEFGHISEEVCNHIGIARDRDSMSCEVMQDHNFTRKLSTYQMPNSQTSNLSPKGKTSTKSAD